MDPVNVQASIDIGDNTVKLIEKLATSLGTTVNEVFPWYVTQVTLEATSFFVIITAVILFFGIVSIVLLNKIKDWDGDITFKQVVCVVSFVITITAISILLCLSSTSYCKLKNPKYYAMQRITSDMSNLVRK